jgi:hypothetical protein
VIMKSVKHQPKREIIDKSQPSKAIWTGLEYLSLPQSIRSTVIL